MPHFPPARRWERDPEVEARGERLRGARNRVAAELDLDAGFMISRALLEEIARRNPGSLEELSAIPDVPPEAQALGTELLRASAARWATELPEHYLRVSHARDS